MKAYRHIYSLSPGRLARGTAGRILIALLPGLARRVRKQPFSKAWGHLGKVIRNGFFVRAVDEEDHVLIQ